MEALTPQQKKNIRKRGHPEKLNAALIEDQIERMAGMNMTVTEIAHVFGVRQETLSRYQKRYPALSGAMERGKARLKSRLKSKAVSKALGGDNDMLRFCLRNLSEWQEKEQAPLGIERTQIIVYLPALESDPAQITNAAKRTIEIHPNGNGNGNGHSTNGHSDDPLETAPRPTN